MTSRQAQEILLRHRPGTSDDQDADVRAALDQAAQDPELAAWLKEHGKFQQQIREKLRSVEAPPGLREQILSEKKAKLSPWRSSHRLVLAALAVVLLAVGVFIWLKPGPDVETQFATFRSRMVKAALRGYAMDIQTKDAAKIRTYLRTRQAYPDWKSPSGLEAMPLMGCAVLTWQSRPATMICYGRGKTPTLWLFVVDSTAFPDPPADSVRAIARVNRLNTVSWTSKGRTYLLAGELDETDLLRLLDDQS